MCDPADSSQLKAWLFSPEDLELCRQRGNRLARKHLFGKSSEESNSPPVECFARDISKLKTAFSEEDEGPTHTEDSKEFLNPEEENLLVSFYASKLPSLIGPMAQLPRLRRESKIPATAATLLRRFYLSNSVMIHDPKTIMVSAAFLASKVEDAMTDVRYLEEGTNLMNSPVALSEILPAELKLLSGVNFELLCFHPYKAVLAITEDLRTYLKSEKGKSLVKFLDGTERPIIGQDLKPMHDDAQSIVNDVVVSDIPLLYTPGQIGLAALIVANEKQKGKNDIPQIDLLGYLSRRFEATDIPRMTTLLHEIGTKLQELKEGRHGCGNYSIDMQQLKGIHKKLKKCRAWGVKEKKKKKKRKNASEEEGADSKRLKTS
mmetsp:Transcript_26882/g.73912  ORF Transcript_26882/g.73912 Transcript_26882/m.73912 type:complete len:375 (-) Transcript_26882:62-1186(-)